MLLAWGGSDWACSADCWGLVVPSLALFILIVECPVGWEGMAVLPMAEHHDFLGFVVVMASCRDGEVVRHVG